MSKEKNKTTITIDYSIWKKLQKLRIHNGFNTLNEVIIYLLKSDNNDRQ